MSTLTEMFTDGKRVMPNVKDKTITTSGWSLKTDWKT